MIQDKIFFDEKDPTGLSYNTPFTFYGSYQGRLWSKAPGGEIKYYTQNSDLSVYATTGSNQFNGNQAITGSLTVTGGIIGTAATSSYVEYSNVANKPTLVSGSSQVSFNGITNKPTLVSGSSQVSFSGITNKPTLVSSSVQVKEYNVFATTGSNGFNGSQSITGSLTVTGQVIAQTLNVQQVTSSIVYSSGSNIFGNNSGNTHRFTGSVNITGSLSVNGALSGASATFSGNVTSDDLILTAGTLFGTGNTGFSNRSSDTTLYLQMPATGFNITDNALNTRFILSSAGAITSQTTGNNGIIKIGGSTYYSQLETNSTLGGLKIKSVWGAANSGIIQFINGTSDNIRMHIADNGNIGIGNTEALELLHLKDPNKNPSIRIDHAGGGSTFMKFQQFSGWNASMTFTSAFNYMGIDVTIPLVLNQNGSNVGIGTTSPAYQLTLNKASNPQIAFTTGDVLKAAITHLTSDNSLRIYNIDGDKITITSGGNVGIGISTGISSKLTVSSSTKGIGVNESNIQIESNESLAANIGGSLGFGATSDYGIVTLAKVGGYRENATGTSVSSYLSFETRSGSGANTERMRITSSGNVGIGTASPISSLMVSKTLASNQTYLTLDNKTNSKFNWGIDWAVLDSTNIPVAAIRAIYPADNDISLAFFTYNGSGNVTERMRITSVGYLKASNDGTYLGDSLHELLNNTSNGYTLIVSNKAASPASTYIQDWRFTASTPNNSSARFWNCEDATANRAYMRSDGGLANYSGNDVNLSDERVKKDIEPLESYWDKFKAIEIVKFKYIDQTHDDFNIGVIAQQVESVAPEFVDVDGWDTKPKLDEEGNEIVSEEEPLKSIYTSDLHHATIKVLQEAMAKIETLEAKIQTLEQQ